LPKKMLLRMKFSRINKSVSRILPFELIWTRVNYYTEFFVCTWKTPVKLKFDEFNDQAIITWLFYSISPRHAFRNTRETNDFAERSKILAGCRSEK